MGFQAVRPRDPLHPLQPSGARSPEEIEETCLDLVVRIVGEKNSLAAMPFGAGPKELVAQVSGSRLDRELFRCGMLPNVQFPSVNGACQSNGGLRNKRPIAIRRVPRSAWFK
jgi:hypothetical protein